MQRGSGHHAIWLLQAPMHSSSSSAECTAHRLVLCRRRCHSHAAKPPAATSKQAASSAPSTVSRFDSFNRPLPLLSSSAVCPVAAPTAPAAACSMGAVPALQAKMFVGSLPDCTN